MRPATQVWDIVPYPSGVSAPARLRRLVLALQVFIDDSGKDDPPVFVLAGFIAEASRWAEFSDAWNAELTQFPAIDHFKMKDAAGRSGEFAGWSDLRRDHKVGRLAALCEQYLEGEIACVTRHDVYSETFKGRFSDHTDHPCVMMLMGIYVSVFDWLEKRGSLGERVDFVFDRQLTKERVISDMFLKIGVRTGVQKGPR